MGRVLLAIGAVGDLVRRVQEALGMARADVDGWFGNQTRDAVSAFQVQRGLANTGFVDVETWQSVSNQPIPSLEERALQLTSHFEGHGFTLAQGNFDGAGITWGIIGFTLKGGELGRIVIEAHQRWPGLLERAFGSLATTLLDVVQKPWKDQLAFADSISLGQRKTRLAEPWRTSFERLGDLAEIRSLQIERAHEDYFEPALATARQWGLISELGIALAFDIHVQNGGIKRAAREQIRRALDQHGPGDERALRILIGNTVADFATQRWQADVRARKLTIANASGAVHGHRYLLESWGLQDVPA